MWLQDPAGAPAFNHIAAGSFHVCALRVNLSAHCWGVSHFVCWLPANPSGWGCVEQGRCRPRNGFGTVHAAWQCIRHPVGRLAPPLSPLPSFKQSSSNGQCGDGSTGWRPYPVMVADAAGAAAFTQLAAGAGFTCGRRTTGAVACWGAVSRMRRSRVCGASLFASAQRAVRLLRCTRGPCPLACGSLFGHPHPHPHALQAATRRVEFGAVRRPAPRQRASRTPLALLATRSSTEATTTCAGSARRGLWHAGGEF